MPILTIDRSKELMASDSSPIPRVDDLGTYFTTHQPDGLRSLLEPGEYLVTRNFLDPGITVGREYKVRAIGQNRYAIFTGQLTRVRLSYGWVLTFENPQYISGDGSLVPAKKQGLGTVFPKEDDFTIYADSAPLGYGLLETSSDLELISRVAVAMQPPRVTDALRSNFD